MNSRLLPFLLLAATAAQASLLAIALDNPLSNGLPGDLLLMTGSLWNTSGDDVFLTSAQLTIGDPDLAGDTTPFFLNAPLALGGGESTGSLGLFTVSILDPFLSGPGIYNGVFTVISGSEPGGQEFSDGVNFQLQVNAAVPEPGFGWLLGALSGALLLAARWKRPGSGLSAVAFPVR